MTTRFAFDGQWSGARGDGSSGAFDSRTRGEGCSDVPRLDRDQALVIAPCSSIHTAFMRFPIDVVFAARDGRVVKVARDVRTVACAR